MRKMFLFHQENGLIEHLKAIRRAYEVKQEHLLQTGDVSKGLLIFDY